MNRNARQQTITGTDVDDCLHSAATIHLLRRALADAPTGAPLAERWNVLQQRIRAYQARQHFIAPLHAADAWTRHMCLFIRPRSSLMATIM
jgi:hypothetical protein